MVLFFIWTKFFFHPTNILRLGTFCQSDRPYTQVLSTLYIDKSMSINSIQHIFTERRHTVWQYDDGKPFETNVCVIEYTWQ